ncbi:MAG TPA: 2-phospho-L-lactate transferase CofD family protein, partial [Fimbriimonadaceae bacterium]|nr:2-phospho-L-lactate transferase CofD family protein [Fimbriimonadaceae bacterium]
MILPGVMAVDGWWIELNRRLFGNDRAEYATHFIGGILIFGGIAVAVSGYRMGLRRLREMLDPSTVNAGSGPGTTVVDAYKRRAQLALGPRVVAIGGGTGLSSLLRGLKNHTANITAVVTVTDDGGSSGRLVQEMGILPPGDLRNCLVALANAEGRMTD